MGFFSHSWGQFKNIMNSPLNKHILKWIHRLSRGLCKERGLFHCAYEKLFLHSLLIPQLQSRCLMPWERLWFLYLLLLLSALCHWLLSSLPHFQFFLSHTHSFLLTFGFSFSDLLFLLSVCPLLHSLQPRYKYSFSKTKRTHCSWNSEFSNGHQRTTLSYQDNTTHVFLPYWHILDSHIFEGLNEHLDILSGQFKPPKSTLWLCLLCLQPELTYL